MDGGLLETKRGGAMMKDRKCILVIDDEDDVCLLVKEKFELLGYKVLKALDAEDGFQKTEKEKPDCVLLDIRLPKDEDGLEYLRRLRSYRHDDAQEQARMRDIPVIILTGAGTSMKTLFESVGISGFFVKPLDLVAIQEAIQDTLKSR